MTPQAPTRSIRSGDLEQIAAYLIPASLIFLALPVVIFFCGWLKSPYTILCSLAALLPIFLQIRAARRLSLGLSRSAEPSSRAQAEGRSRRSLGTKPAAQSHTPIPFSPVTILLVVALCIFLVAISGIGGYGMQDIDWEKHNALLKDLSERPWPVVYQLDGRAVPIVYYVAYYLPAALLGKLVGWQMANYALLLWSFAGFALSFLWFAVLVRRLTPTVLLLFVFFSGLDLIGRATVVPIVNRLLPNWLTANHLSWEHIEHWSIGWQYSSHTTLLFWVPHQALAGWIGIGLLLYALLHQHQDRITGRRHVIFYLSLITLWSPFILIGLAPYALWDFLRRDQSETVANKLRSYISLPNLCGLLLLLVLGLYFSAKLYNVAPSVQAELGLTIGFIPKLSKTPATKAIGAALLPIFYLLEFGLLAALLATNANNWDKSSRGLFLTAILCLCLFPFVRIGVGKDFVMRTSIPALFVLAVFAGKALYDDSFGRTKKLLLIAILIIGSATACIEIKRHLLHIASAGTPFQLPDTAHVAGILDLFPPDAKANVLVQYIGSADAPFFRFLAPP